MKDFLAAPFLMVANLCMYITCFITGKYYLLVEAEIEEDSEDG